MHPFKNCTDFPALKTHCLRSATTDINTDSTGATEISCPYQEIGGGGEGQLDSPDYVVLNSDSIR